MKSQSEKLDCAITLSLQDIVAKKRKMFLKNCQTSLGDVMTGINLTEGKECKPLPRRSKLAKAFVSNSLLRKSTINYQDRLIPDTDTLGMATPKPARSEVEKRLDYEIIPNKNTQRKLDYLISAYNNTK